MKKPKPTWKIRRINETEVGSEHDVLNFETELNLSSTVRIFQATLVTGTELFLVFFSHSVNKESLISFSFSQKIISQFLSLAFSTFSTSKDWSTNFITLLINACNQIQLRERASYSYCARSDNVSKQMP